MKEFYKLRADSFWKKLIQGRIPIDFKAIEALDKARKKIGYEIEKDIWSCIYKDYK